MHAPKRRFEPAVIERLFQRAVPLRILPGGAHARALAQAPWRAPAGHGRQFPALPEFDVARLPGQPGRSHRRPSRASSRRDAALAGRGAAVGHAEIRPHHAGLHGPAGQVPARCRRITPSASPPTMLYDKDEGPRAFLDTFSNRSLALFYEAWRKYRLELKYQLDGKDTFLPLLLALAGSGQRVAAQAPGRRHGRRRAGRVDRLLSPRRCATGPRRRCRSRACCPSISASR